MAYASLFYTAKYFYTFYQRLRRLSLARSIFLFMFASLCITHLVRFFHVQNLSFCRVLLSVQLIVCRLRKSSLFERRTSKCTTVDNTPPIWLVVPKEGIFSVCYQSINWIKHRRFGSSRTTCPSTALKFPRILVLFRGYIHVQRLPIPPIIPVVYLIISITS